MAFDAPHVPIDQKMKNKLKKVAPSAMFSFFLFVFVSVVFYTRWTDYILKVLPLLKKVTAGSCGVFFSSFCFFRFQSTEAFFVLASCVRLFLLVRGAQCSKSRRTTMYNKTVAIARTAKNGNGK